MFIPSFVDFCLLVQKLLWGGDMEVVKISHYFAQKNSRHHG